MNIEAFLLCDAATDQRGKLNVLGAFDNIFSRTLPVMYPACAIVTRIRFEKIEAGEHSVRINIIDADGRAIGPKLEGNINVKLREDMDSSVANLILNLHRLKFETFGKYRVDLAIDGQLIADLPFNVREVLDRPQP